MAKVLSITINNDWIKIIEASHSSKGIQVFSATTIRTPEGSMDDGEIRNMSEVVGAISAELARNQMGSKNVIFSMQSTRIASKEVLLPMLKEPKLSNYIKTNSSDFFPVDIKDFVLTYSIVEAVDTNEGRCNRTMLVIAPSLMVQGYYALAKELGLTVSAIDYLGNSNLQVTRLQIDERPSIVIQIGEDSTSVNILHNNMLRLMRSIPYGKSTVAQALIEKRDAENLSIEDAYRIMAETQVIRGSFSENEYVTDSLRYLVNNISRVMDYYTAKYPDSPIDAAYIMTEGPGIVGIDQLFHDELSGIDVVLLEQLVDVDTSASNIPNSSVTLYITNIGAIVAPMNFIPNSQLEEAKKANSGKYVRLLLYVSIAAALILVGFPLFQNFEKQSQKSELEGKIASLQYVKSIVSEYYVEKDRYSDIEAFEGLTSNFNDELLDFVEFLENDMPSDISISNMSIGNGSVSMSITGSSKETMAAFLVKLNSNPSITLPSIPALSETVDANGLSTVTCSATCNFIGSSGQPAEDAENDAGTDETGTDNDDIMSDYEQ